MFSPDVDKGMPATAAGLVPRLCRAPASFGWPLLRLQIWRAVPVVPHPDWSGLSGSAQTDPHQPKSIPKIPTSLALGHQSKRVCGIAPNFLISMPFALFCGVARLHALWRIRKFDPDRPDLERPEGAGDLTFRTSRGAPPRSSSPVCTADSTGLVGCSVVSVALPQASNTRSVTPCLLSVGLSV